MEVQADFEKAAHYAERADRALDLAEYMEDGGFYETAMHYRVEAAHLRLCEKHALRGAA